MESVRFRSAENTGRNKGGDRFKRLHGEGVVGAQCQWPSPRITRSVAPLPGKAAVSQLKSQYLVRPCFQRRRFRN